MKKILILFIVPILFGFRTGQEIDDKRMNRDLEIAKNILATLVKSGSDSFFGGSSIEASYIAGYGVIFNIPEHLVYFHSGPKTLIAVPEAPVIGDFDILVDAHTDFVVQEEALMEQEKALVEQEKALVEEEIIEEEVEKARAEVKVARKKAEKSRKHARAALAETRELKEIYVTSDKTSEIDWEEIMLTFLADYADLIGQLQPDEKIVINQKSPYDELIYRWSGVGTAESENSDKAGLSVEVLRKDVKAYKIGKINREEFDERVTIKKNDPQTKTPDLEMFASIFDRYYSFDLSETYYCEGKPRYEVLDGYGVVFHVNASTSSNTKSKVHFYTQGQTWTMDSGTDDVDDSSLYPKFKEDIKAFMLDYGRTIRSLNDDEKVVLEIKISSCQDCKIPKILKISSEMAMLKKYDQQKISREKALAEIEMKEQY